MSVDHVCNYLNIIEEDTRAQISEAISALQYRKTKLHIKLRCDVIS